MMGQVSNPPHYVVYLIKSQSAKIYIGSKPVVEHSTHASDKRYKVYLRLENSLSVSRR